MTDESYPAIPARLAEPEANLLLRSAVEAFGLGEMLTDLDSLALDVCAPGALDSPEPLVNAATVLLGVRWLIDQLRDVSSTLEEHIGKRVHDLPGSLLPIEGHGVVQGKWAAPPRSITDDDRRAMAARVAEYARGAPRLVARTGEVEDDPQVLLRLLLEAFRLEPRKTALRPMGVNTDDYGERRSGGRWTCKLLPNE